MKGFRLAALLVPVLLCGLMVVEASGSRFSVARVSDVDHPTAVYKGSRLTVEVTCEYVDRVLADVAILDMNMSRVAQSRTLISQTVGPGNVTFTFDLSAPRSEGIWSLAATTRAWWADSWFSDPTQGVKFFDVHVVGEDLVPLSVMSEFGFELDGVSHPRGDVKLQPTRGLHLLRVEPIVEIADGARLVFDRWSDGVSSNPRSLLVASELSLSARYRKQNRLVVESEIGAVSGAGWYEADSDAQFAAVSNAPPGGVLEALGFRSVFAGWEGDVTSDSHMMSVRMSRPKSVRATWRTVWGPNQLSSLLSVTTIALIISGMVILLRSRRRRRVSLPQIGRSSVLGFILLALISLASAQPCAAANEELMQTGSAYWRHWGDKRSSTCLIWVGGGVMGERMMINPYWLESFNTMRYVQELAEYYGVLTLERGGSRVSQPKLNRTIDAEFYPSQSLQQARRWANSVGYRYVFLVGYSVGGIAALNEVTGADPSGWGSPNGVVLITVPISASKTEAQKLRANLLLLYGEKMTGSYTESGRSFYHDVPDQGAMEKAWFHKEFHVLSNVAHEVWTIADSGQYDARATRVTVSFIERSKSLQLNNQLDLIGRALNTSNPSFTQLDVSVPTKVRTNSLFQIQVRVSKTDYDAVDLVAYDVVREQLVARETLDVKLGKSRICLTVDSPRSEETMRLAILALACRSNITAGPEIIAMSQVQVTVTDRVTLTVQVSTGGVEVSLDGIPLRRDLSGRAQINTTIGPHLLRVTDVAHVVDGAIDVFDSWSDGVRSSGRSVMLTEDLQLDALFRRMYRVDVRSRFGVTHGGGWYENESMAVVSVSPIRIEAPIVYLFAGWGGHQHQDAYISIAVKEPVTYEAKWTAYPVDEPVPIALVATLLVSIVFFGVTIFLSRAQRRAALIS